LNSQQTFCIGFAVRPRRWVVERFFAWLSRNRRLAKDFEASLASAEAFLYAASVMLLIFNMNAPVCHRQESLTRQRCCIARAPV